MKLFILLITLVSSKNSDVLIYTALNLAYQDDFTHSVQVFDTLISLDKANPLPYVFKAGILDSYMLDHSTVEREDEFYDVIRRGLKVCKYAERKARTREDSAWIYFSYASLFGYRAVRKGRNKNYLSGLRDAYRAISYYKKTIKTYPKIYDAYIGLGTFHFALSELPRFVKWFVAPGDYREKALKEIKLAADSAKYSRVIAMDEYAWVLAYVRPSHKAVKIAEKVVKMFPKSRSFLWTLAFTYRRRGYWWKVERTFLKLVPMTLKDQRTYHYSLTILFYNLARAKYFTGKLDDAAWYLDLAYFNLYFVKEKQPDREQMVKSMDKLKTWIEKRKSWRRKHGKRPSKNS